MKSDAQTVAGYLRALPQDRRDALTELRKVVLENLPEGFEENMNWGMISYEVPLSTKPNTYNGQPLMYVAIANQKNYMSVYLCGLTCVPDAEKNFSSACLKSGLKLDMGKACIRFKKIQDIDLKLIAAQVAGTSVENYIKYFEAKASSDRHKRQSLKSRMK
jgi:uncharacterized protein YdhG (YjbR/CyaY superfamily)